MQPGKGMTLAESNELLRNRSERARQEAMKIGNYDPTREALNFEVTRGGKIIPLNKKVSIPDRIASSLASRGIKDPNANLDVPKFRTLAKFIFGGSRERMRELAFGAQEVDFGNEADNSHVKRCEDIEKWARDVYKFMGDKYGEENIAAFVVHLDETNPHVHCVLLPIKDGKFKYKEIFAGKDKFEFSAKMKALHDELSKVNSYWKLERGTSRTETHAKHRSTEEYRRSLTAECNSLESDISQGKSELTQLRLDIKKAMKAKKGLETMIANLEKQKAEKEALIEHLNETLKAKEGDPLRLKQEIEKLTKELEAIDSKLADKKEKYQTAEQQYDELIKKMDAMQKRSEELEAKGLKYAHNEDQRVQGILYREMLNALINEQVARMSNLGENGIELFEGSLLQTFAEQGNEFVSCCVQLFHGLVCDATTFAKSHGGGGTTNNNWGRKKDDDDNEWMRRCAKMATRYLKASNSRNVKR